MSAPPARVAVALPWTEPAVDPPRFTVLPADTPTARRLRSIDTPGVVLIDRFGCDEPTFEAAATGVMVGLGKDIMLAYIKRWGTAVADGWLAALAAHTVVLLDAEEYPRQVRAELAEWLSDQGLCVWFTWTAPRVDADIVAVGAEMIPADEFWATFPPAAAPQRTVPAPEPALPRLPRLPRVDGIMFRSTCRDLLTAEQFAYVDDRFCSLVEELVVQIRSHQKPSNKWDLRRLRRLVERAESTDELLLSVRAAQVAFLREGRFVDVNTAALLGAAEALARPGYAVPQRWWERLEAYWDPDVPAAVALHHAGVSIDALAELTIGDVTLVRPDEATVAVDGEPERIVGPPARFVVALVVFRRSSGATASDRLFVTHRAIKVRRPFVRDRLLADPAFEVGVRSARPVPTQESMPAWLRRYGIVLTKLWKDG